MTVTRFQLVFRRNGEQDQNEIHDTGGAPHLNGKLIVDGRTYTVRGVDWIIRQDGRSDGDEMARFICTLAATPDDA